MHSQCRAASSHKLLLECAEEAGLDVAAARSVLASDAYRREVAASFEAMQQAGINSIPVLSFEVEGAEPVVHHGSGSVAEFRAVFEKLDAGCAARAA